MTLVSDNRNAAIEPDPVGFDVNMLECSRLRGGIGDGPYRFARCTRRAKALLPRIVGKLGSSLGNEADAICVDEANYG